MLTLLRTDCIPTLSAASDDAAAFYYAVAAESLPANPAPTGSLVELAAFRPPERPPGSLASIRGSIDSSRRVQGDSGHGCQEGSGMLRKVPVAPLGPALP